MLQSLSRFYRALSEPISLEEALRSSAPRRVVEACLAQDGSFRLIDSLAFATGTDKNELCATAAKKLRMIPAWNLELPTPALIELTGHSPETLAEVFALPQSRIASVPGYAMVVADPAAIDRDAYDSLGVRLFIAPASQIEDVWNRYRLLQNRDASALPLIDIQSVLLQLAKDATKCGASEVFLGHPEPQSYEFLASGQKFRGQLHPAVMSGLTQLTEGKGVYSFTSDSSSFPRVSAGLTKNFSGPVICLTWGEMLSPQETESLETPSQTEPMLEETENEIESKESAPETREAGVPPSEIAGPEPTLTVSSLKVGQHSLVLIDDDDRFSQLLKVILQGKGWEVTRFPDGRAGLDYLREHPLTPQLVICDVHMPNMDGVSFLKSFRDAGFATPVLMLTSDQDSLLEAELACLGADAYIRKQEDPRVLLAWCNNLVSRRGAYLNNIKTTVVSSGILTQHA